MTLIELGNLLEGLGYPVAYSHFKEPQKPPYVIYVAPDTDPFSADNRVIFESINVDIELYVRNKSMDIENQIKELLNENELPYVYAESYINDQGVFKCTFSTQLI